MLIHGKLKPVLALTMAASWTLAVRNLFDELCGGGQIAGGPSSFTAKGRQAFANQVDRWLTTAKRQ